MECQYVGILQVLETALKAVRCRGIRGTYFDPVALMVAVLRLGARSVERA